MRWRRGDQLQALPASLSSRLSWLLGCFPPPRLPTVVCGEGSSFPFLFLASPHPLHMGGEVAEGVPVQSFIIIASCFWLLVFCIDQSKENKSHTDKMGLCRSMCSWELPASFASLAIWWRSLNEGRPGPCSLLPAVFSVGHMQAKNPENPFMLSILVMPCPGLYADSWAPVAFLLGPHVEGLLSQLPEDPGQDEAAMGRVDALHREAFWQPGHEAKLEAGGCRCHLEHSHRFSEVFSPATSTSDGLPAAGV